MQPLLWLLWKYMYCDVVWTRLFKDDFKRFAKRGKSRGRKFQDFLIWLAEFSLDFVKRVKMFQPLHVHL